MRRALIAVGLGLALQGPAAAQDDRRALMLDYIERAKGRAAGSLGVSQREDGSWDVRPPATGIGLPSAQTAVTAAVVRALRLPGCDKGAQACRRGEEFLLGEEGLANDRRSWTYGFLLPVLAASPPSENRDRAVRGALAGIDRLLKSGPASYPFGIGTSFESAFLAVSLLDARGGGLEIPDRALGELLDRVESARSSEHGGFVYHLGVGEVEEYEATVQRNALCEVALRAGGRSPAHVEDAVDGFLAHLPEFTQVLSSTATTHANPHRWAKYEYLLGIYGTSRALEHLPAERARAAALRLGAALFALEKNGTWVDSREYAGPAYGTAAALLSLEEIRKALER